jgi:hypothetical protein
MKLLLSVVFQALFNSQTIAHLFSLSATRKKRNNFFNLYYDISMNYKNIVDLYNSLFFYVHGFY